MQKRYFFITILTGLLLILSVAGYLYPPQPDVPATRILLVNKGGKVIFSHKSHIQIENDTCKSCHHTSVNNDDITSCGICHANKFDEHFAITHQETIRSEQCATCHHSTSDISLFSHIDHESDYTDQDCQSCHHDATIEPEPQACSNCHKESTEGTTPSLMKATHQRCADCHDDMYLEGLKGCRNCHSRTEQPVEKKQYQSCSNCHATPVNEMIPTRKEAFHAQCMGCHEEQGTGPFGNESCSQCHMQ